MTGFDTGGEVNVQAQDGEMFTLDTSMPLDFATGIRFVAHSLLADLHLQDTGV
jgi:hypothetical protein